MAKVDGAAPAPSLLGTPKVEKAGPDPSTFGIIESFQVQSFGGPLCRLEQFRWGRIPGGNVARFAPHKAF